MLQVYRADLCIIKIEWKQFIIILKRDIMQHNIQVIVSNKEL